MSQVTCLQSLSASPAVLRTDHTCCLFLLEDRGPGVGPQCPARPVLWSDHVKQLGRERGLEPSQKVSTPARALPAPSPGHLLPPPRQLAWKHRAGFVATYRPVCSAKVSQGLRPCLEGKEPKPSLEDSNRPGGRVGRGP